jgi:hypothetical protein
MAWILVKPLVSFRTQIKVVAPNRDLASDGSIGDWIHALGDSDHNPDDTGKNNAGWDGDADKIQEVRAIDVDKDFRADFTPEQLLAHMLKYCRNGTFWWIRYIIYDGYIYHKNVNNFARRVYTGGNKHGEHLHFSNDWTEAADRYTGANYRFEELLPKEEEVTPEDIEKIAEAVTQKLCKLTEFPTGGGSGSRVGAAVWAHGYPENPGGATDENPRRQAYNNLQDMAAEIKEVKALVTPEEVPGA